MLDIRNDALTTHVDGDVAPAPVRLRRRLIDEVAGVEALLIAAFWLFATTLLAAIAPAPDPETAQPPLVVGLNIAFNIGFVAALGGAATRRRLVHAGSIVAGGAMAIMATFCGLEGHTGLWIPAQFILGAGIAAYGVHRLRN